MAEFQESSEELTSSMFLDLQSGNPLEVMLLNGAVSRIGKEVGVETPVNDFITACLSYRQRQGAEAGGPVAGAGPRGTKGRERPHRRIECRTSLTRRR